MKSEGGLTKRKVAELLGLPDASSVTKHRGGSFTYTASFTPTERTEGRAPEITADLVERARAAGYTLHMREVSSVLGAVRGYAQRFTFDLVKNDADPGRHGRVLICATSDEGGRPAYAALTLGTETLKSLGLVEGVNGLGIGAAAVFDALTYLQLPAVVAVLTDPETARALTEAQAGRGAGPVRRALADRPGLRVLAVTADEAEAFRFAGDDAERAARMVSAYGECLLAAGEISRAGQITRGADALVEAARATFRQERADKVAGGLTG